MVKKLQKMSAEKKTGPQFSSSVKDSAQQIWLAGLGAFSKAQEEGSKVFETLVKEGLTIQRKTQATAEEKISEATSRITGLASDIQAKAGNRWDKLENIFEERVAKALSRLGVPSISEVNALTARIDQLEKSLQEMNGAGTASSSTPKPTVKPAAKSAAKLPAEAASAKVTQSAARRVAKKTDRPASGSNGNPGAVPGETQTEKSPLAKRSAVAKSA